MFFPLGDDNPAKRTSLVTYLLIAANAAMFLLFNVGQSDEGVEAFTRRWAFDVDHPFSRQLFTSMFMHAGWAHLLGNMWMLWIVGNNVEDKLGGVRYLLLYVLGGAMAAWSFAAIDVRTHYPPEVLAHFGGHHPPLVGASGAIAAVMGCYIAFFPEARIRVLIWWYVVPIRAKWFLGLSLLMDLVYSAMAQGAAAGGVATMAHVGGGLFGLVIGLLLKTTVGGGGEGDAWDVHTGFAKRPRPGAEAWVDTQPHAAPPPVAFDESGLIELEREIARLTRTGRVREAIDLYPAYVAQGREQPLPDDVQIEIAHEFYRQWLPKDAIPAYLRYLDRHPAGDQAGDAKLRLGVLYGKALGDRAEALRWLREAAQEHPDDASRAAAAEMVRRLGG